MHWKGLRLVADGSSKRQSTIEDQSRRSEHLPRPLPPATEPRLSESIPRSPAINTPGPPSRGRQAPEGEGLPHSNFAGPSSGDTSSLRRNRFSFMRLRHASDPQLSKTYTKAGQDAPPVPSLPPPTIITTAPTSHELDQPVKQRSKLNFLPSSRKQSMEELPRSSTELPSGKSRRRGQGSADSQAADSALATAQSIPEEPGRLSTTSRGNRDHHSDSQRSSVIDPRFSESSRSDQSYGDQTVTRTNSPRDAPGATATKRFRMPRLKRTRSPLFPLPPKIPQSTQVTDDGPRFPPVDTPKSEHSDNQDQISPLPSPSRSTVQLAPASSVPPLFRNDSTNSARSVRSNSSFKNRGRSSTMGSLAENQDDLTPSTYLASSGRTSTSTSGRKSFGDMFNITQRLRQNSSPPAPRGSPGGSSTPVSKPESFPVPKREETDTAATYLSRLEMCLPRGMIAGVLAQSDEEFYKVSLRKYMRGFSYFGDPIDMAIRKLLMEVELPKETQQIDRFLQAFADRYHECNPGIFVSPDKAYFIAFSILILHTDVFNKNNKRKMQKPDYVKNCRGEGIAEDILECFYENISYTPFIHVEDANLRDRHLAKPRRALFKTTSSENLGRISREPVDPYTLILDGKLETLRPSLKDVMDLDDTYDHFGTAGPPDMDNLHQAFTKSGILQIISLRSRPDAFMPSSLDNPLDSNPGLVDIKVAKVGILWRKDPKKKRARSPWQEWGAILTFSQLYFFRNVQWVRSLMAQHEAYVKNGRRGTLVFRPPLSDFKPDGIMSTNDAVALLDSSYKKHKHAFMFVRHNALEETFLAQSEPEMNDWLAHLNYAAAFRTTGVRTKGMIATNYEGQRYRRSQRLDSVSSELSQTGDLEPDSPSIDTDIVAGFIAARRELMSLKIREANEKLFVSQKQLEDLLQNARHLQILTPVHARAREGVIMAAGRLSAKLKWVRQDIWRNKCYRQVLLRDLGEDEEAASIVGSSIAETSQSDAARMASLSGPSVKSEPSVERAGSILHTASSRDPSEHPVIPTDQTPDTGLLIKPSNEELRRPSIPGSTTSGDVARIGRRRSIITLPERAKSYSPDPTTIQLEREASVLSRGSKWDGASLASRASKLTAPVSFDDTEERLLREAGLLDVSGSPNTRKEDDAVAPTATPEKPAEGSTDTTPGDRSSRVRRSLHRTLRDSHAHRHHSHSKKNRGSVSSIGQEDESQTSGDGEVLSRKAPSFTVHGKKASIVTFGSEWQNIPPEERLKLRKPTPHEEPRTSEPILGSGESLISERSPERPHSLRSMSTTTGLSLQTNDENDFKDAREEQPEEDIGRPASQVITSFSIPDTESDSSPVSPTTIPNKGYLSAPQPGSSHSQSSTSLNERIMDTPSSENLREQTVGA